MATFETDGARLAYDVTGSGPPLVFLHGLSMSRHNWDLFVPKLESLFRVVRLDQRGHGESDHAGDYVLDSYLADTAAFLDGVVGGPSILVGHSLGGVIAHGIAQTRPELVTAVLLEDPPLYVAERMQDGATRGEASPVAQFFPAMQQLCRDMQARGAPIEEWTALLSGFPSMSGRGTMADVMGPDGVRAMAEAFSRLDPEVFTPAIDGTAIAGAADPSSALGCPVTLLRADPSLGPAFAPEDEPRFLEANTHARVVMVEGASHQIHDEQPELFLRELTELAEAAA